MKKNNLDEMQEQELLRVEHYGCWLAFWALPIAMIVQNFALGKMDFKTLAGEWIVFMVLALYLAIACVRRGIWDRRLAILFIMMKQTKKRKEAMEAELADANEI